MPNIIRSDFRQVKAKILMDTIQNSHSLYFGVNGTAPWFDEYDPPQPKDTSQALFDFWDHLIGFQRIYPIQCWTTINHIKWVKGRTFETIRNDEDMDLQSRYYCVNSDFEVYLCISATITGGNYPPASVEPKGHNNGGLIDTNDGYVWQYIYKVKLFDIENKVSDDFIPVYIVDSDKPNDQVVYGINHPERLLNVRTIGCRVKLKHNASWGSDHYRQYGMFLDIRNESNLEISTADQLLPSEVLKYSGYIVYMENIKKTPFYEDKTDIIDMFIEC